jgi:phage terminase large subunit-like protein
MALDLPWMKALKWAGPEDEPGMQGSPVMLEHDRELEAAGYYFDKEAADKVIAFAEECCTIPNMGSRPFIPRQDQRCILRRAFGWKRPNGLRRYHSVHVWTPKTSGKTPLGALVALYGLLRPNANVIVLANDAEQAKLMVGDAKQMVMAGQLEGTYETHADGVSYPRMRSHFKPGSSSEKGKHGFRPYFLMIDEVHEFRNDGMFQKARLNLSKIEESMEWVLSTAGDNTTRFGYKIFEADLRIFQGIVKDPHSLVMVFGASPEDDWRLEETWYKANPGLGSSIGIDRYYGYMRDIETGQLSISRFKCYYLNVWTNEADMAVLAEDWLACKGEVPPLSYWADKPHAVCGGMDLARHIDASSFVTVVRDADDRHYVYPHIYIPADNIEAREKQNRVPYRDWVAQGYMIATPGDLIDYDYIREDVKNATAALWHNEVGYDPYGAADIAPRLLNEDGVPMVELRQNYATYTSACRKLQELVKAKKIVHDGNPCLAWMVTNMSWRRHRDSGMMPKKSQDGALIDAGAAMLMAMSRLLLTQDAAPMSDADLPRVLG